MTHTEGTIYGPMAYWYIYTTNALNHHKGPRVLKKHFGLIEIDWDRNSISFSLRGSDGATLVEHNILISQLYTKAKNEYFCSQSPKERYYRHLFSTILLFNLPLLLNFLVILIFLRK